MQDQDLYLHRKYTGII